MGFRSCLAPGEEEANAAFDSTVRLQKANIGLHWLGV